MKYAIYRLSLSNEENAERTKTNEIILQDGTPDALVCIHVLSMPDDSIILSTGDVKYRKPFCPSPTRRVTTTFVAREYGISSINYVVIIVEHMPSRGTTKTE